MTKNNLDNTVKSDSSGFKLGHLNVRSLYPKIDQLDHVIHKGEYDIFAISETWLTDSHHDSELKVNGYNIFRKDRLGSRGGGVCLYIKDDLEFKLRDDLTFQNVEALWGEITVGKLTTLVCVIYRSPSQSVGYYESILDMLEKAAASQLNMIILGDLNFHYTLDENMCKNPIHYIEQSFGMQQLITDVTRNCGDHSSTIDVILTTMPDAHCSSGVKQVTLSDHYLVYTNVSLNYNSRSNQHKEITFRDYKHFSVDDFVADINNQSVFDENLSHDEVTWETWKTVFLEICDKHAPFKRARVKNRSNPWITKEVVALMYRRDKAHELYVRNKNTQDKIAYKYLRNEVTSLIRKNKYDYFDNVDKTCRGNPVKFWREIKSVMPKLNYKSIPRSITADEFNVFFASVPSRVMSGFDNGVDDTLLWKGPDSIHRFQFSYITQESVLKLLQSLPDKSGNDVLGFDRKLLKLSANFISCSLSVVLNQCINSADVKNDWKVARVTPIYKNNGDMLDKNNYRPISVIGHIAKILEQLVQSQLLEYLQSHCFISADQSAYLARHSTQTCLHRAVDDWLENVNENQITGAILLDISKCFDVIDHNILLQKLSKYGIKEHENHWFKSYLTGRKQAVTCHNSLSEYLTIDTGVPQGSVLGPFLFLLFINDVANFVTDGGISNLFADDNFIYVCGDSVNEVQCKLQRILDSVSFWYRKNRLKINTSKTKIMIIGSAHQIKSLNLSEFTVRYEGDALDLVTQAKYLGLMISSDLSWDAHIQHMCKQLYYYISLFRRLSNIFPRNILIRIYKAYIQPRFDYGVTVWGCTTQGNLDKIQRIQNQFARIITGNYDYINVRGADLLKSLKLYNIKERRDYFLCVLMFKCIHGIAPYYLSDRVDMAFDVMGYPTRNTDTMNVYLPTVRKDIYRNSLMYIAGKLWNNLPDCVKESPSLDIFKHRYTIMSISDDGYIDVIS